MTIHLTEAALPAPSPSQSLEDEVLVQLQRDLVPEVDQGRRETLLHALEDQARHDPEAPTQVSQKACTYFLPVFSLSGFVWTCL